MYNNLTTKYMMNDNEINDYVFFSQLYKAFDLYISEDVFANFKKFIDISRDSINYITDPYTNDIRENFIHNNKVDILTISPHIYDNKKIIVSSIYDIKNKIGSLIIVSDNDEYRLEIGNLNESHYSNMLSCNEFMILLFDDSTFNRILLRYKIEKYIQTVSE